MGDRTAKFEILRGRFRELQTNPTGNDLLYELPKEVSSFFTLFQTNNTPANPILQFWLPDDSDEAGLNLVRIPLYQEVPIVTEWRSRSPPIAETALTLHLTERYWLRFRRVQPLGAQQQLLFDLVESRFPDIPWSKLHLEHFEARARRHRIWRGSDGTLLASEALLREPRLTCGSARLQRTANGWQLTVRDVVQRLSPEMTPPLPPGGQLKGVLFTDPDNSQSIGESTFSDDRRTASWMLPADLPVQEARMRLQLNSNLRTTSDRYLQHSVDVFVETAIKKVRLVIDDALCSQIPEGCPLEQIWVQGDLAELQRIPVQLTLLESERTLWAGNLERVGARDGGIVFTLSSPIPLPQNIRPGWLQLDFPSQDVMPPPLELLLSSIQCRWALRNRGGKMERPSPSPQHLEPAEGRWPTKWSMSIDHRARLPSGKIVPLRDDVFRCVMLDPEHGPLAPSIGARNGAVLRVGMPDLPIHQLNPTIPPTSRDVEPFRQYYEEPGVLRVYAAEQRGILYPSSWISGRVNSPRWKDADELLPVRGGFALSPEADLHYLLWLRGLFLEGRLVSLTEHRTAEFSPQWMFKLDEPLPVDSRLGFDVRPHLPLQAYPSHNGALELRSGSDRIHLTPAEVGWELVEQVGGDLLFEYPGYGFVDAWDPDRSRDVRYGWQGMVWQQTDKGVSLMGWVLSEARPMQVPADPARGRSAWGLSIRASQQAEQVVVASITEAHALGLSAAVCAMVEQLLTRKVKTPQSLTDPNLGAIRLAPLPGGPPLFEPRGVRVSFSSGRRLPDVRVFVRKTAE